VSTQPSVQWILGSFLRAKRVVHEADHSPLSSVEVTNAWSYTSIPQYVLMVWYLIKKWMQLYGVLNEALLLSL
jgi:hypothetical protein